MAKKPIRELDCDRYSILLALREAELNCYIENHSLHTMVEHSVIKEAADTIDRLRGIVQVCAWSIASAREKMHDAPASADLHLAEALTAIGECGFRIDGKSLPWVANFRKAFAADVAFCDDDEVVEILSGGLPANMKREPNEHDAS